MQQLMRVAPSMADVMLQALWRMIISVQGILNRGNHWNDATYFGDVIVTRTLETPTDEALLFRLMRDESTSNENVSLIALEIWLR